MIKLGVLLFLIFGGSIWGIKKLSTKKYKLLEKSEYDEHTRLTVKSNDWFSGKEEFISGKDVNEWFQFPNGLPCEADTNKVLGKLVSQNVGFFEKYPD